MIDVINLPLTREQLEQVLAGEILTIRMKTYIGASDVPEDEPLMVVVRLKPDDAPPESPSQTPNGQPQTQTQE